jgi:hypothetical protein
MRLWPIVLGAALLFKFKGVTVKIYWLAEFLEQMDSKLAPAEQEYVNSMLSIVKKYGKLADRDSNGIWVGYVEPEDNDNFEMGIKCSNCAFMETETSCQIVARPISPGGYCRLAAIPPGLVTSDGEDDSEDDGEED